MCYELCVFRIEAYVISVGVCSSSSLRQQVQPYHRAGGQAQVLGRCRFRRQVHLVRHGEQHGGGGGGGGGGG